MRPEPITSMLAALGLLLGIHNGCIALLEDGNPEPLQVYPCRASMLPEADQHRLSSGIRIENESRLHRLLEDYLS